MNINNIISAKIYHRINIDTCCFIINREFILYHPFYPSKNIMCL